MRWQMGRRSENIEDRRGLRAGPGVALGGGGLLLVLVIALLTGADPAALFDVLQQQGPVSVDVGAGGAPGRGGAPRDEMGEFVAVVLGNTEDVWTPLFSAAGRRYQPPTLVLFDDAVQSACGLNSAAVGPFYCPPDQKLYIDLAFYRELDQRFGAPGDFAQAYVIAHEVGHHVQNLLGISDRVMRQRARLDAAGANALSVRLELQADCFAGVWGHYADRRFEMIEAGDVEEGLRAAAAIGDDRLQRQARGYVAPESFTHGTSAQRVRWFRQGLRTGRVEACDTFGTDDV